jgi:hypothetical protein
MNAANNLHEAMKFVPLRSHKAVLTILGPYFNPEMLAAAVNYVERFEALPMGPEEITEIIFKLVGDITENTTFRKSKTRKVEFVFSRQLAMFAIYTEVPQYSLQKVAHLFTPKYDHATVLHACKSMEARYAASKSSRETINALAQLMAEHSLYSFQNRLETITVIA